MCCKIFEAAKRVAEGLYDFLSLKEPSKETKTMQRVSNDARSLAKG